MADHSSDADELVTARDVLERLGAASVSARVRTSMGDFDGALASYANAIDRTLASAKSTVDREALAFLERGRADAATRVAREDKIIILRRAMDLATDRLMNPNPVKDVYDAIVGAERESGGKTTRLMTFVGANGDGGRWRALNDGVMGGMSDGFFAQGELGGNFVGNVSLDRNGGFASVRASVKEDGSEYDGIYVDCVALGDNAKKLWLFILKDDLCAREQMNFKTGFRVQSEMGRVKLPFEAFNRPERMGRAMYREPLRLQSLVEFGFMILKGDDAQVGRFALGIKEIGLYRA